MKLEDGGTKPLVDSVRCMKFVGSLLYLTHTRIELSCVVGLVSNYIQKPHELYWKDAIREIFGM